MKFLYYKPSDPWPQATPFHVSDYLATNPAAETISSSRTGVYTFYVYTNNEAQMRRKVLALSGSITESGFWTGSNWISANTSIESEVTITAKSGSVTHLLENAQLIISRGGSLIIEPGAKFMFANGTSVMVRGTFHANGTSSNPIVFELEKTGASSWNGISVANPSIYNSVDFVLNNAQLSRATCAIHIETPVKADVLNCSITNVYTMGIEVVPNWGGGPSSDIALIKNTNIAVFRCHGIVIANTSDVRVEDCTIIGHGEGDNPLFAGISLNNASPRILRTSLSHNDYGLLAVANSSPILQDVETGGHNIIRDNLIGVKCDNYSNAILGDDAGEIEMGGQNCIHSNGADVYLTNSCGVAALYNYWGSENGPDPQKLFIEDASWLKYEPYLTGDPNESSNAPVLSGTGGGDDPISENPAILQAIHYRVLGRYQAAIALLRNVVGDRSASTAVKTWAITELLNNVRAARIGGHAQYLRTLATTNPELVRAISSTLPQAYIGEDNSEQAVNEWDRNIQAYPNSVLECDGLYGKFFVALYRDHDLTQAGSLLSRLDSRYPDAHQTQLAEAQLALAQASHNGLWKRNEEKAAGNAIPSKYRLEQNYPNPFNPTTEIRFDLPDAGNVSLVVFDVLGREVAELASEYREAGYHSARWNASNQASGVYFARFSVINAEGKMAYSKVNKLMLIR